MSGALTYEEVLRATMRSNWIHALWLFAVVVLIWVCTILLTLYGNRKKKPKDKDDSWQVSVFLLVLVVIGYGICVGTSVPEENARIQRDIDEHAYVTVHGSYTRNAASRRRCLQKRDTLSRVSFLEAPPGFEPGVKDLQSHALPLGYGAKKWSGLRDSNSLPPPWQGGALPNELCPHFVNASVILPQKADLSSFF